MKKLFITVLLLITCIGSIIVYGHHLKIVYADDTVGDYYANHRETDIRVNSKLRVYNYYTIFDMSWYDDTRKKSREDFDRIYEEIMAFHSDAVHDYCKSNDGQHIEIYPDKVKSIDVVYD